MLPSGLYPLRIISEFLQSCKFGLPEFAGLLGFIHSLVKLRFGQFTPSSLSLTETAFIVYLC